MRPAGKCSLGRRPGLPRCACDLAGLRRSGSGSGGGAEGLGVGTALIALSPRVRRKRRARLC